MMKILYLLILLASLTQLHAQDLPVKTIAVLKESPSPYFDKIVAGFTAHLTEYSGEQYELKIKEFSPRNVSKQEISKLLDQLINDPNIDVIFTAGIASCHIALELTDDERTKPIIAGAIEFSDFENKLITPKGNSRLNNYSFVLVPSRIPNDLAALSDLADTKVIDVLIDASVLPVLTPDLAIKVAAMEKRTGIELRIHPVSIETAKTLPMLAENTTAVYVPVLPSFSRKQRIELFNHLTKKKILHLSMVGKKDVEAGAFATLSPDISKTLHKRLALNIHQTLLGVDTKLLPVMLQLADQLTINLKTAAQMKWSPDYDTSLTANFINKDSYRKAKGMLTLEHVMSWAEKINPDVTAARASWLQSYSDVQIAKAGFRPTANIKGNIGLGGTASPISSLSTPSNSQSVSLGFEINQLLYSHRVYSQIQARTQILSASKFDQQSIILDTMESTAHAYLDALTADALYDIQQENLQLVLENLHLAKLRLDIGASDNTDYLRWQASVASARSDLIAADSNRQISRINLNIKVLSSPQTYWNLKDIPLGDDETYFLNDSLMAVITNQNHFRSFIRFIKEMSSHRAPELRSFDKNLVAQGIVLRERTNRNKKVEVSISATAQQIFADTSITRGGNQSEWMVGIGFTIPVWEKQIQKAESNKIHAGIMQLQAQRTKATYLIQQRALSAAYNMSASHPNMRLSRRARKAAEANYVAILKKYKLGQVGVVTLLDAQSNLLARRQVEATSVYTYLKDIISLQRSIAWFEFTKNKKQISSMTEHFKDYLKTGSIHVRIKK
ncbi:MAG: outer membrane protein [Rubritalea sp.]|jgi:outer membrane protein